MSTRSGLRQVYPRRYAIPVAGFAGSPLTGTAPLTVTFSNSSLPLTYTTAYTLRAERPQGEAWTFGDGATSTLTNPVHSFTQTGSYTVTLTMAEVTETDTLIRASYITVSAGGCVSPMADFSGTPLTGTAPLTVSFTDASSGTISGWWWSFGDGGSSSETNPSHGYTQTGVYTVSLTVSGACGSDVLTRTNYITVSAGGCVSPTAGFSGSPLTGTAPLTVSFTDASSGTISGRWWSFGDGGSSSETNPSHGYTQTGVYTVSLTVSGACGSDVLTRTNYITVSGGYTATTTTITYTYDALQRLTGADYSDDKSFTYAYDAAGNRTAYTETITQTVVTTYTYDAANRLTAVGNVSYTYDDRGNLTHDGVYTYTWDGAGRLVQAESVTHTLAYTYSGDGVRVASAADGTETRYVQDVVGLPQVLVETTGGATVLYLYGFSRLAQVQGTDTEWFLGDALGSVRQLVDDDGVVLLARDYDPYGQMVAADGTGSSGYGFTGEQYDRYIDMLFLRARWYSVQTGRFLSQDPWIGSIQRPRTLLRYAYGLNNPLIFADPSGQMCIAGFDVGFPGCTPEQRERYARNIAFLGGFVSTPAFAEGFLLELVDTVGVGAISISSSLFEHQMEQLGISSLGGCWNLPIELLSPYSNFVHNPDPSFQTGRAAGRLAALILGLNEVGIGIGSSTVAAVAAPFTFGVSIGAGAVTLSISAHGAVVVGTVVVKEVADPLLLRLGNLASMFSGSSGAGSDQPNPSDLRKLTNREVRKYGLHEEKQAWGVPPDANLYVDKTTGVVYYQVERGAPYEELTLVPELRTR